MFGPLGIWEILFILALALLIFGPRKLPEIGRTLGRSLGEFRKATTDLKRQLNTEMIDEELRQSDPRHLLRDDANGQVAEKPASGDGPGSAAASRDDTAAAEGETAAAGAASAAGTVSAVAAEASAPIPETVPRSSVR